MIFNGLINMRRFIIYLKNLFKGYYPIGYVLYRIFDKENLLSSQWFKLLYKKICLDRNQKIGKAIKVNLKTYDGLDQAVHPSCVMQDGKLYMVVTPFPYGNDKLENPCIYVSEDGLNFEPINGDFNPVALPTQHDKLSYLSDPFMKIVDGNITLIYRECVYKNEQDYTAVIYIMENHNFTKWENKRVLFRTDQGGMSPCIFKDSLYYVEFYEDTTRLIERTKNKENVISVENEPNGMMLWHIDFFSHNSDDYGLFAYSTDHSGGGTRLFLAKRRIDNTWECHKEILLDNKKTVAKMYKSCVIAIDDRLSLYISLRRKDRFWGIYVVRDFDIEEFL